MARGPDVDLADPLVDHGAAQVVREPDRPEAEDRVRLTARGRAGEVGAVALDGRQQARDQVGREERRVGGDGRDPRALGPVRPAPTPCRSARRRAGRRSPRSGRPRPAGRSAANRCGSPLALSSSARTCGCARAITRSRIGRPPSCRRHLSPPPMRRACPPASSTPTTGGMVASLGLAMAPARRVADGR